MEVEKTAVQPRESRKRSKASVEADDAAQPEQGTETEVDVEKKEESSLAKDANFDQISSCSTVSPGGAAGSSSPNETPPTSGTPEQASDSGGSHPHNSPVNLSSAEEESAKRSDDQAVAATQQKATKHNDAEQQQQQQQHLASMLRFAKNGEHVPPLLPSPASPAQMAATGRPEIDEGVPKEKETKDKDRVGGLDWGERRRKTMMDKAYQGFEGMPRAQQVARLKQTVARLQSALPEEAKTTLLNEIRRYLVGEVSPEELAEAIKVLVDAHNVVVPLQEMPAAPPADSDGGWGRKSSSKREAGAALDGVPSGKKQREPARTGSRKNGRRRGGGGGAGGGGDSVKEEAAEDTSAWEALLSVCTMGMK